ncbi:TlpA family protein disulfide reductase [Leptospira sp. WS92.C1]
MLKTRWIRFSIFLLLSACIPSKEESILYKLPLTDLEGNSASLKKYKGKALLLDVWASWCEPCKEAVPVLEKLSKDLEGKNGVLLGINTESELSKEERLKAARDFGMTYPSLVDQNFALVNQYKVEGQPALIVFSKSGTFLKIHYGIRDRDYPKLRLSFENWLAAP